MSQRLLDSARSRWPAGAAAPPNLSLHPLVRTLSDSLSKEAADPGTCFGAFFCFVLNHPASMHPRQFHLQNPHSCHRVQGWLVNLEALTPIYQEL